MKVISDFRGHYEDTVERYFDYEKYGDNCNENIFMHGQGWTEFQDARVEFETYSYKATFNYEQPCAWQDPNNTDFMKRSADSANAFSKIYTVCPYSATWLNEMQGMKRFIPAIIPYPESQTAEKPVEKQFDILYWGAVHNQDHLDILDVCKNYKYNFLTLGFLYWALKTPNKSHLITAENIPRARMWELIRKTKITVGSNLLYLNPERATAAKQLEGWQKNRSLERLGDHIMPQMKTRPLEAVMNRSLLLMLRDPWNVIEEWFEPEKEFLYYDDKDDLQEKVQEITNNWEKYEHITEAAYQKAFNNYTTKHLFDAISKKTSPHYSLSK